MELRFCFHCYPSSVDFTSNREYWQVSLSAPQCFGSKGQRWSQSSGDQESKWTWCLVGSAWAGTQSCTNRGRPQSVRTGGDLSHLPGQPGLQVAQPEWSLGVWGCHRQAGIWDTHLAGIVQGCAQPQSGLRAWEQHQWVRFWAFHCWCASCTPVDRGTHKTELVERLSSGWGRVGWGSEAPTRLRW